MGLGSRLGLLLPRNPLPPARTEGVGNTEVLLNVISEKKSVLFLLNQEIPPL